MIVWSMLHRHSITSSKKLPYQSFNESLGERKCFVEYIENHATVTAQFFTLETFRNDSLVYAYDG